jgi:hypothetical protein
LKMGSIITMEDGSISDWRWQHQQHTTWASRQTQEEAGSISSNPNPLDIGPRVPRPGLQSSLTLVCLLADNPLLLSSLHITLSPGSRNKFFFLSSVSNTPVCFCFPRPSKHLLTPRRAADP